MPALFDPVRRRGRGMTPLPKTAARLLADLHTAGGSLEYRDARVVTSGLTGLRHRGLARVETGRGRPARVVLTEAGKAEAMGLIAPDGARKE